MTSQGLQSCDCLSTVVSPEPSAMSRIRYATEGGARTLEWKQNVTECKCLVKLAYVWAWPFCLCVAVTESPL